MYSITIKRRNVGRPRKRWKPSDPETEQAYNGLYVVEDDDWLGVNDAEAPVASIFMV